MALIDFELVQRPLSEALPCGPDLDLEGDAVYMNLMARIEGLLPESYFSFERTSIDFNVETEALSRLLDRTHDLRVLAFLAKLLILDRNLGAFVDCVVAMAGLLESAWADVHPTMVGEDGTMRSAVLQTLDDPPNVVLPLQYYPLVQSRRTGAITFRSQMVAAGEATQRAQDPVQDQSAIEHALSECDLPALIDVRDQLVRLHAAVGAIVACWIKNAGFADAPNLERLSALAEKMASFLDGAVARRDPAAARKQDPAAADAVDDQDAPDSEAAVATAGGDRRITSAQQVAETLAGVIDYLARKEPSSPALLLVKQAEQLVGKNFVDIMRILVPNAFDNARIQVGADQPVAFPLTRLSKLMPEPEADESKRPAAEPNATPEPGVEVTSRAQAMARLEEVGAFYRSVEPSSPIPLLTERARSFASLDFMSLLKEIVPRQK